MEFLAQLLSLLSAAYPNCTYKPFYVENNILKIRKKCVWGGYPEAYSQKIIYF